MDNKMEKKMNQKTINAVNFLKNVKIADAAPELEGISFRYKTVQFHLIDDTFEEIEKHSETFGDVKIYSERFSLPGYGITTSGLTGDEFQFEIIVEIESKVNPNIYYTEIEKILDKISKKHGVDIVIEAYDPEASNEDKKELPDKLKEVFNLHKIVYYTNKNDVFPEE